MCSNQTYGTYSQNVSLCLLSKCSKTLSFLRIFIGFFFHHNFFLNYFFFRPSRTLWNRPKKLENIAPNTSRVKFNKREAFKERFNENKGQEKLAKVLRVPKKYSNYDEEFAKVTNFESQMESLKFRGFQRPYR